MNISDFLPKEAGPSSTQQLQVDVQDPLQKKQEQKHLKGPSSPTSCI